MTDDSETFSESDKAFSKISEGSQSWKKVMSQLKEVAEKESEDYKLKSRVISLILMIQRPFMINTKSILKFKDLSNYETWYNNVRNTVMMTRVWKVLIEKDTEKTLSSEVYKDLDYNTQNLLYSTLKTELS